MGAINVPISALMEDVRLGRVVLPDFQRSFVWKPDDIQDLLVSVLGRYYIGSMLYMDTITSESPFALRLIEGVEKIEPSPKIDSIIKILLDGQQRTSSLFYALRGPDIPLAGRKGAFKFFLNIPKLLDEDWAASVSYAVSTNKKAMQAKIDSPDEIITTDLLDFSKLIKRFNAGPHAAHIDQLLRVITSFTSYEVQMVALDRGTSLERVVETFERINRTGEPLAVTDLLIAKLYKDSVKLRDLIASAKEAYTFPDEQRWTEEVLRVMCLLRGMDVRRTSVLDLKAANFEEDWKVACDSLSKAYERISDTKNGYGAFSIKSMMPLAPMAIALAALLEHARQHKNPSTAYDKIDEWYWVSVFSNRYNEAVNTRILADYNKVLSWINGGSVPDFISSFAIDRVDFEVESRASSVYRGVLCLTVIKGALDFQSGQPPEFEREKLQDDHIFPKSVYSYDKVLNRTLISTNAKKGDKTPKVYFGALETLNGRSKVLEILETHFVNEAGLDALLHDDLKAFTAARKEVLVKEIEARTPHRSVEPPPPDELSYSEAESEV